MLVCFISSILTRTRSQFLYYLLLHIAVFAGGMLRLEIATVPKIPNHFYDKPVSFTGKTVYQPERGEAWDACYAVGEVQLLSDAAQKVSTKLLLRFQDRLPLRYGKHLTLTGVLRQPQSQRNPGGFDYRAYLARQKVSGIIEHKGLLQIGKQSGFLPLRWIEALRLKTEVCSWFFVRAAKDRLFNGLDWELKLVLIHEDSSFSVLVVPYCTFQSFTKSGSCFSNNSKQLSSTSVILPAAW